MKLKVSDAAIAAYAATWFYKVVEEHTILEGLLVAFVVGILPYLLGAWRND